MVKKKEYLPGIKLTPQQKQFAEAYLLTGSIIDAAVEAYPRISGGSDDRKRTLGENVLFNGDVKAYIQRIQEKALKKIVTKIEDVERGFWEIYNGAIEKGDYANANRAMENLGKWKQMFVDKKEVSHSHMLTIDEDVINMDIPRLLDITGYNKGRKESPLPKAAGESSLSIEGQFSEVPDTDGSGGSS